MPDPRRPEARAARTLSARNPHVGRLAALVRKRSERTAARAFVLEGPLAVADALRRGVSLREVYLGGDDPGLGEVAARAAGAGATLYRVDAARLARCLSTVTSRPLAAVADQPAPDRDAVERSRTVLVLAGVADPGNLGTLVRTAEAAGIGAVWCCDASVDPFNPKAVRASAGAICDVPVIGEATTAAALAHLGALGFRRVAATADAPRTCFEAELSGRTALVLGSEAHGLPSGLDGLVDVSVRIPMRGRGESLNVAAAGAVLCFETVRQQHRVAPR